MMNYDMKGTIGYEIQQLVMLLFSNDVSFNEPRSLKEGDISQALHTNKVKFSLTHMILGKFNHYVINDPKIASIQWNS